MLKIANFERVEGYNHETPPLLNSDETVRRLHLLRLLQVSEPSQTSAHVSLRLSAHLPGPAKPSAHLTVGRTHHFPPPREQGGSLKPPAASPRLGKAFSQGVLSTRNNNASLNTVPPHHVTTLTETQALATPVFPTAGERPPRRSSGPEGESSRGTKGVPPKRRSEYCCGGKRHTVQAPRVPQEPHTFTAGPPAARNHRGWWRCLGRGGVIFGPRPYPFKKHPSD